MLVPQFRLNQDPNHIQVLIRLPYVKVSHAEFYITSNQFKFYLKPYLLSLGFEQKLRQSQQPASLLHDHNKHLLQVKLLKQTPGQQFTGLDLLPRLLIGSKSSKKPKDMSKKIVVQCETTGVTIDEEQKINAYSYGFSNNYTNVFVDYEQEAAELFAFNPEQVSVGDRGKLAEDILKQDFDPESYLFDLFENEEEIQIILETDIKTAPSTQVPMERDKFLELLKIPAKNILMCKNLIKPTLYQLLSVSFSYIYELYCMSGELSPESAKTINKTSPVLCGNINFSQSPIKQVLITSYKRCITYSLYKHLAICQHTLQYLKAHFSKDLLISMLCELHKIFSLSQVRHFLNKIYIDDYIIFLQQTKNTLIEEVRQELQKMKVSREDLGWNLESLEQVQ